MPTTVKRPLRPQPAKWLLVQAAIPQQAVARRAGVVASQVSGVLNGRITPARRIAAACAALLGRPVEELFDADLLAATHWYLGPEGGER